MKGMDVEAVTEFGHRLRENQASQVREIRARLLARGQGLNWEGTDAQAFMGDRIPACAAALDRLAADIEELGKVAIRNAQAQADVSASL